MKLLLFTVSLCLSAWLVLTDSNEFNCPPLPLLTHPAESVHELKPQDIKVAMALGDSITAGNATCIARVLLINVIIKVLEQWVLTEISSRTFGNTG